MEHIAVTRPDMGVLAGKVPALTPFGLLSYAFAQALMDRMGLEEGGYPGLPLELLEEGEAGLPAEAKAPVIQLQLELQLQLLLNALDRGLSGVEREAAERVAKRLAKLQTGQKAQARFPAVEHRLTLSRRFFLQRQGHSGMKAPGFGEIGPLWRKIAEKITEFPGPAAPNDAGKKGTAPQRDSRRVSSDVLWPEHGEIPGEPVSRTWSDPAEWARRRDEFKRLYSLRLNAVRAGLFPPEQRDFSFPYVGAAVEQPLAGGQIVPAVPSPGVRRTELGLCTETVLRRAKYGVSSSGELPAAWGATALTSPAVGRGLDRFCLSPLWAKSFSTTGARRLAQAGGQAEPAQMPCFTEMPPLEPALQGYSISALPQGATAAAAQTAAFRQGQPDLVSVRGRLVAEAYPGVYERRPEDAAEAGVRSGGGYPGENGVPGAGTGWRRGEAPGGAEERMRPGAFGPQALERGRLESGKRGLCPGMQIEPAGQNPQGGRENWSGRIRPGYPGGARERGPVKLRTELTEPLRSGRDGTKGLPAGGQERAQSAGGIFPQGADLLYRVEPDGGDIAYVPKGGAGPEEFRAKIQAAAFAAGLKNGRRQGSPVRTDGPGVPLGQKGGFLPALRGMERRAWEEGPLRTLGLAESPRSEFRRIWQADRLLQGLTLSRRRELPERHEIPGSSGLWSAAWETDGLYGVPDGEWLTAGAGGKLDLVDLHRSKPGTSGLAEKAAAGERGRRLPPDGQQGIRPVIPAGPSWPWLSGSCPEWDRRSSVQSGAVSTEERYGAGRRDGSLTPDKRTGLRLAVPVKFRFVHAWPKLDAWKLPEGRADVLPEGNGAVERSVRPLQGLLHKRIDNAEPADRAEPQPGLWPELEHRAPEGADPAAALLEKSGGVERSVRPLQGLLHKRIDNAELADRAEPRFGLWPELEHRAPEGTDPAAALLEKSGGVGRSVRPLQGLLHKRIDNAEPADRAEPRFGLWPELEHRVPEEPDPAAALLEKSGGVGRSARPPQGLLHKRIDNAEPVDRAEPRFGLWPELEHRAPEGPDPAAALLGKSRDTERSARPPQGLLHKRIDNAEPADHAEPRFGLWPELEHRAPEEPDPAAALLKRTGADGQRGSPPLREPRRISLAAWMEPRSAQAWQRYERRILPWSGAADLVKYSGPGERSGYLPLGRQDEGGFMPAQDAGEPQTRMPVPPPEALVHPQLPAAEGSPPQRAEPAPRDRMDSDYVRTLPDWAQQFLRSGGGAERQENAPSMERSARDIAVLSRQQEPEELFQWTSPEYRPQEPLMFREQEGRQVQEKESSARTVLSAGELRRTADELYRMIEDRIRRERRRLGL